MQPITGMLLSTALAAAASLVVVQLVRSITGRLEGRRKPRLVVELQIVLEIARLESGIEKIVAERASEIDWMSMHPRFQATAADARSAMQLEIGTAIAACQRRVDQHRLMAWRQGQRVDIEWIRLAIGTDRVVLDLIRLA